MAGRSANETAAAAAVFFVRVALAHDDLGERIWGEAGFVDAFCPSRDWVAESRLAIDQAPIVIGLENHRSGLLWQLVSGRAEVQRGLRKLGFRAPWLDPAIA